MMYKLVKSLSCTPETNVTLYINNTQIKKKILTKKKKPKELQQHTFRKLCGKADTVLPHALYSKDVKNLDFYAKSLGS